MLRFGTVLALIQNILDEPTSVISKKIDLPAATVSAYQAGTRFPRNELPAVYRAVTRFFQATLPELGHEYYESGLFLSEALSLEKAFRRITEFNPIPFQIAATKLLAAFLVGKRANNGEDKADAKKCLSTALKRTGVDRSEKEEMARYLFEMGREGFFLELSKDGALKTLRFLDLSDFYNIFNMPGDTIKVFANLPLTLDVMMSLPERIDISIDNANDFQSFIRFTYENDWVEVQGGKLIEIKF